MNFDVISYILGNKSGYGNGYDGGYEEGASGSHIEITGSITCTDVGNGNIVITEG